MNYFTRVFMELRNYKCYTVTIWLLKQKIAIKGWVLQNILNFYYDALVVAM